MPQPIKWLLGIVILIGIPLCVLSFGNPQWGKWVYCWQCYVYPKGEHHFIHPPKNFSGVWNSWYENGLLKSFTTFDDGAIDGLSRDYSKDGILTDEWCFANNVQHGTCKRFNKLTGNLVQQIEWHHGAMQGPFVHYYPSGHIESFALWDQNGSKIAYSYTETDVLFRIRVWLAPLPNGRSQSKIIYEPSKNIDLRYKYQKEITKLEFVFVKFEAEASLK